MLTKYIDRIEMKQEFYLVNLSKNDTYSVGLHKIIDITSANIVSFICAFSYISSIPLYAKLSEYVCRGDISISTLMYISAGVGLATLSISFLVFAYFWGRYVSRVSKFNIIGRVKYYYVLFFLCCMTFSFTYVMNNFIREINNYREHCISDNVAISADSISLFTGILPLAVMYLFISYMSMKVISKARNQRGSEV